MSDIDRFLKKDVEDKNLEFDISKSSQELLRKFESLENEKYFVFEKKAFPKDRLRTNDVVKTASYHEDDYLHSWGYRSVGTFNSVKYDEVDILSSYGDMNLLLRVPARPTLRNADAFRIYLRLHNLNSYRGGGVLVKIVSEYFDIRNSIFELMTEEVAIFLRRKTDSKGNIIRVKVYVDNIVVRVLNIDLWERRNGDD